MATKVTVNGKTQSRPGVYATIKNGIKNPPVNQSYGNILIIDTGIGAGFAGGSGINGVTAQGIDSIYSFDTIQDFQNFVKGGELWNLGKPLFQPAANAAGVSKVSVIKAATTTPAEIAFTLTNGSFVIRTKDEGVGANGVLSGSNLSNGFGAKITSQTVVGGTAGEIRATTGNLTVPSVDPDDTVYRVWIDINLIASYTKTSSDTTTAAIASGIKAAITTAGYAVTGSASNFYITAPVGSGSTYNGKSASLTYNSGNAQTSFYGGVPGGITTYQLNIYHGTYKGLDTLNNVPYDGVTAAIAKPQLIIQSPAVSTVAQLIAWMQGSQDFNAGFALKSGSTATGNLVSGDVTNGYVLATGGTESFSSADFDAVLEVINNLDFTHILSTEYGTNATAANNAKLLDFVVNTSKYDRLLVVAGGYDKSSFKTGAGSSAVTSAYFNEDNVIVVHGGVKKVNRSAPNGFLVYNQLYHAAQVLGRCAGLPSQVPVTLKSLAVDGFVHPLSDAEQEYCLAKGIMYSYYDYQLSTFVAGQGITSIQSNDFLVNDDGTTFSWQLKRIQAELNKSIIIEAKKRFFNPNGLGGNMFSTSEIEVQAWLEGFLLTKTASDKQDNLILNSGNIVTVVNQDSIEVNYEFRANREQNKMIVTGTMID